MVEWTGSEVEFARPNPVHPDDGTKAGPSSLVPRHYTCAHTQTSLSVQFLIGLSTSARVKPGNEARAMHAPLYPSGSGKISTPIVHTCTLPRVHTHFHTYTHTLTLVGCVVCGISSWYRG